MAFPAIVAKVAEFISEVEKKEQESNLEKDEVNYYSKEIGKDEIKNLKNELGKDEIEKLPKELTSSDIKNPGAKVEKTEKKGGSYKDVFKEGEGKEKQVHHMPAFEAYGKLALKFKDGPTVKMDIADHRKTASFGNSKEARAYREQQKELINSGHFRDAVQMDIDDLKEKFGDKYDEAIEEMMEYVDKLEQEGTI